MPPNNQPPTMATTTTGNAGNNNNVAGSAYPVLPPADLQVVGSHPQEPPPSYHAALSMPSLQSQQSAYSQPAENPAYPKSPAASASGLPPQYDAAYPALPNHRYGPPPPNVHLHHVHSAPMTIGSLPTTTTAAPVIVTVTTSGTVMPGANCPYCRAGIIRSETDLCCLLVLIVLAIFTFPIGLVYLCCIPCTIHKRCMHCQRVA